MARGTTGEDLVRIEMSGTQLGGRGRIDGQDAEGRWAIGLAVTFTRGGFALLGHSASARWNCPGWQPMAVHLSNGDRTLTVENDERTFALTAAWMG
jgi:hypothetical protein